MWKVGRVRKEEKREREIQIWSKMSNGYMRTSKHKNGLRQTK